MTLDPTRNRGPVPVPPKITQNLDDIGTRYRHYSDLREVFALGVEILKGLTGNMMGSEERARLQSLTSAVREIDKRIDALSGYEALIRPRGLIANEIDALPKPRGANGKETLKDDSGGGPINGGTPS